MAADWDLVWVAEAAQEVPAEVAAQAGAEARAAREVCGTPESPAQRRERAVVAEDPEVEVLAEVVPEAAEELVAVAELAVREVVRAAMAAELVVEAELGEDLAEAGMVRAAEEGQVA